LSRKGANPIFSERAVSPGGPGITSAKCFVTRANARDLTWTGKSHEAVWRPIARRS
jgi:hypothetical protein